MKKVLKIIVNVLAWVLLIFALLVTLVVFSTGRNNGVANLFGFIPLTVESDSMKPTFKTDDLIICREVDDVYDLKEDDVITFWTYIDGQRVKNTHRIVEIEDRDGVLAALLDITGFKLVEEEENIYAGREKDTGDIDWGTVIYANDIAEDNGLLLHWVELTTNL